MFYDCRCHEDFQHHPTSLAFVGQLGGASSSPQPLHLLLLGMFALIPTKCCPYAVRPLTASFRDDGLDMLVNWSFRFILKTGSSQPPDHNPGTFLGARKVPQQSQDRLLPVFPLSPIDPPVAPGVSSSITTLTDPTLWILAQLPLPYSGILLSHKLTNSSVLLCSRVMSKKKKKSQAGTGMRAQWVKNLLSQYENLSLNSQNPRKASPGSMHL